MKKWWAGRALLSVAAALCGGCGGRNGRDWEEIVLQADSVAVSQIIRPIEWTTDGNRCVMLSKGTDTAFYVYGLPDFGFLYSSVTYGSGPGELTNGYLLPQSVSRPGFWVTDYGRDLLENLSAGEGAICFIRREPMSGIDPVFLLDDSLAVSEGGYDADKIGRIYLTGISCGQALDSVPTRTVVKVVHDRGGIQINRMNNPLYVSNGKVLALGYEFTDRMEFYDVSGGRFSLLSAMGDQRALEELRRIDFWEQQQGIWCPAIAADGNRVYVLETEYRTEEERQVLLSSSVRAYDWQGRLQAKYRLERPADQMLVYGGRLYCYDSEQDFEQVYVYRLEENR